MIVLLTINSVKKYYNNEKALENVSLNIPMGICYGLVGPNGAGKSTLLKIVASVIQDFSGAVQFTERNLRIGYVPQEIALEETVSARGNLHLFGKLYGLHGKDLKKRTDEVLIEIGLEERKRDKVKNFSGGMKRRLNIGCAIMHRPNLIIMDEPTVGIDPQSRRYIFQMIERYKKEGSTIIYASHYMEEIEQLCDEAAFMDDGEIIEKGSLEKLLQKYAVPSIYVKGQHALPIDIEHQGTVTSRNGGYLITTDTPLAVMENMINFYKKNEKLIERLELVRPRLEDVFFSLTGNQLRD